jgi:uncharacterized membrane protein YkvA (DUF1232 family)
MRFPDLRVEKRTTLMAKVYVLYSGIRDPRIKWHVKILSLLIVAYVVSPIDLIPDFIPILGLLDEAILVPIAISLVVRLIPCEIYNELNVNERRSVYGKKIIYFGGMLIISIWLLLLGLIFYLWIWI